MIPAAYSVAIFGASVAFAILFARQFGFEARTWQTLGSSSAAALLGAAASYEVLQALGPYLPLTTTLGLLAQAGLAGAAGLLVWLMTLWLLKSQEFFEIRSVIYSKLGFEA
jgi:hypothetical protein